MFPLLQVSQLNFFPMTGLALVLYQLGEMKFEGIDLLKKSSIIF